MVRGRSCENQDVLKRAKAISSKGYTGGEAVTTYYILNGQLFRVDDWWCPKLEANLDEEVEYDILD